VKDCRLVKKSITCANLVVDELRVVSKSRFCRVDRRTNNSSQVSALLFQRRFPLT